MRRTKEDAEKTRIQIIDAARTVFHQFGVSCSSLDRIAREANLTRGAVYWHFKDKAELFVAMREDVFTPMRERTDKVLFSESFKDPLDAIEACLNEFFRVLEDCPVIRQVFEIMLLRCEYVDDFVIVQEEVGLHVAELLRKYEMVYRRAAEHGSLRDGLDPKSVAQDTWAFITGVIYLSLNGYVAAVGPEPIPSMIRTHMMMRRKGP